MITTYNNQWNELNNLLHRNWRILESDTRLAKIVVDGPRLIARRACNLQNRLSYISYDQLLEQALEKDLKVHFHAVDARFVPLLKHQRNLSILWTTKHIQGEITLCWSTGFVQALRCPCQKSMWVRLNKS